MIRAAAKNSDFAAVLVDPADYEAVLAELREPTGGSRCRPASASPPSAFATTARYDAAISSWFARAASEDFPPPAREAFEKVSDLRYGENPHQRAAFYARVGAPTHLLAGVEQLHGKELSFNNLLDLSSARELVEEFDEPGLRDRQAQQPLRLRDRRDACSRPTSAPSPATRRAPTAA